MNEQMTFDALGLLNNFEKEVQTIDFIDTDSEPRVRLPLKDLRERFKVAQRELRKELKRWRNSKTAARDRKKPQLSHFLDWHAVHKSGQNLWSELMSAALRQIDPNSKGNSKLFKFLDVSTEFEDLLYGLERYYRDHTLHSLWVYLIGVQLMGKGGVLQDTGGQLNWYLFNDIEQGKKKYPYPEILVKWAGFRERFFSLELKRRRDAIWCIMALCHDLGYSLAKLRKLNDKVVKVLEFFHVSDFEHVGYSLEIEHQYLVSQFLDLMAMDVRIVPGEGYKELDESQEGNKDGDEPEEKPGGHDAELTAVLPEIEREAKKILDASPTTKLKLLKLWESFKNAVEKKGRGQEYTAELTKRAKEIEEQTLVKCYRDDSTYWRLCKALERKEHGILSAYLLYKTLGIFADTSVRGAAEEWGLEDEEVIYNVIRGDILFAIAQHEFAYAHLDQLGSLAEILILCDELEEFTRLGRQLQSREYHDTAASASVRILDAKRAEPNQSDARVEGRRIHIEMHYKSEHAEYHDFKAFFWRKAKRLCTVYSLGQERGEDELVYNLIESISARFEWQPNPKQQVKKLAFLMRTGSAYATLYKPEHKCDERKCEHGKMCPMRRCSPGRRYEVKCVDDRICIVTKCPKDVTLKEWLDVKDDE